MTGSTGPAPVDQDDIVTQPECVDPDTLVLVRLYGNLRPEERKRLIKVVEAWAGCTLDRRVTIEAVARELAKVPAEVT